MKLINISKGDFDKLPTSQKLLCQELEFSHKFALLSVNEKSMPLALCWRSEAVEPQIIDDDKIKLLWLGIDQQIIALDKVDSRIVVLLNLPTNLLELALVESAVILRTELEIFAFNLDGSIRSFHWLPEISESIEVLSSREKTDSLDIENLVANVQMIDGEILQLQI